VQPLQRTTPETSAMMCFIDLIFWRKGARAKL
jgi:hypothetical protein